MDKQNLAKISCSYFIRSGELLCRICTNIENENTIGTIALRLWESGIKIIKKPRRVQILFMSYRGKVRINEKTRFLPDDYQIKCEHRDKLLPTEDFKLTKKQLNRIDTFISNKEIDKGAYFSDDEEGEGLTSDLMTNDAKGDENSMHIDQILDSESMDNINMLKNINFIKDGKFTVHGDRVFLEEPCGNAFGDFIKNRNKTYNGRQGLEYCISRISYHDRFVLIEQ